MRKHLVILLVLALCLTSCLTGCKKEEVEPVETVDTEFRTVYSGELTRLNYLVTSTTAEQAVAANTVDGLVEYDHLGVVQPCLATEWELSPDGTVWTFKLREGVKWYTSEGEEYAEVTAQDFVDAAEYLLTADNESKTANLYFDVVAGAREFYHGETDDFDTVGVKAVDPYTLQYTLEQPVPYFLSMLTYVCFLPVNGEFLAEAGDRFGTDHTTLLYNGAYLLKNFQPQDIREYVKNENYWDKDKVYIEKLTYRYNKEAGTLSPEMFVRGEVTEAGISSDIIDSWIKDATKKDMVRPAQTSYYTYFYAFNFDPKFAAEYEPENWKVAVNNLNFRKSIFHALDRTQAMLTAEPYQPERRLLNTVTPRNFVAHQGVDYTDLDPLKGFTETESFNEELALEYRDLAVAELEGKAKLPVKIMMPYNTSSADWTNRVQVVEQQLENLLGDDYIDVIPVGFPPTNFLSETRRAGNYCMQEVNWGPDYADPNTYTDPFYNGTYNWPELAVGYTEPNGKVKYYNLVDDARAELLDTGTRYELFAVAEAHLIDEAFLIPYAVGGGGYVASKLDPFSSPYAPFGTSNLKFKGQKMLAKPMSTEEYLAGFARWEADRAAALKAAGQ